MKLHGMAHNVCNLIVTPVIKPLHGVQDTPLDRLQPVVDMRHRTFQNDIRGIIQKPVLVHACQLVLHIAVGSRSRSIV